jgi:hypothetical protein
VLSRECIELKNTGGTCWANCTYLGTTLLLNVSSTTEPIRRCIGSVVELTFNTLKSDIVRTVLSFLGMINVGDAHRDDGCHSNTPILHSHLIYFINMVLCLCRIG